jgi:hypothetical protein
MRDLLGYIAEGVTLLACFVVVIAAFSFWGG